MLDELWTCFKERGYYGSVSVRNTSGSSKQSTFLLKSDPAKNADESATDFAIFAAIYDMDPEYTAVCIVKKGYKGSFDGFPVISCPRDKITDALDNAILEGLGHKKAFFFRETGAVVLFGYKDFSLG